MVNDSLRDDHAVRCPFCLLLHETITAFCCCSQRYIWTNDGWYISMSYRFFDTWIHVFYFFIKCTHPLAFRSWNIDTDILFHGHYTLHSVHSTEYLMRCMCLSAGWRFSLSFVSLFMLERNKNRNRDKRDNKNTTITINSNGILRGSRRKTIVRSHSSWTSHQRNNIASWMLWRAGGPGSSSMMIAWE